MFRASATKCSASLDRALGFGDDDIGLARQLLEAMRFLDVAAAAVHDRQPGVAIIIDLAERGRPRVELPEGLPELRFVVALDARDVMIGELHELRDAIDTGALSDLRDREGR
ncbi:hypothetical protein [Candidatus Palauibacter sp.]|uniref:hypothetical protein n=1 Tax=Candidatus Palauibacter sp. TaxID=3101350 RepID=UPI003B5A40B4